MRKCKTCGEPILNKRKDAIYCSDTCRKAEYRKNKGLISQFNTDCIVCRKGVLYYPHNSQDLKCNECGTIWRIIVK